MINLPSKEIMLDSIFGKQLVCEDSYIGGDAIINYFFMSSDLTLKSLSDFEGKKKVISIVPSLETDLCSTQTRTFNKELSELEDTVVITVSVDLPFAQARWCGAEKD